MKAHFSFSVSVSLKRDLSVGSLRGTGEGRDLDVKLCWVALRVWKRVTGEPRRAKHNAHATSHMHRSGTCENKPIHHSRSSNDQPITNDLKRPHYNMWRASGKALCLFF